MPQFHYTSRRLNVTLMRERVALIEAARAMAGLGINQGSAGNISVRAGEAMLITPSAIPYDDMTPEMVALMKLEGEYGAWEGPKRPSSEWRFHLDILRARPEIGAIVHTHAPHATAIAMTRRDIPPCHYMITRFGGGTVRCAPYALFGTAELSAVALAALEGRTACLLANHGFIATGATLEAAMTAAVELEALAKQYILAVSLGGPVLLTDAEIEAALEQFATAYKPNE
jgi:L-fuculose-phosphate aldolase